MKKDAGTFTLTMPVTVTDSIFFTKGYLVTDSFNLLKIPDNGVVTGASDSSFVIGAVKKTGDEIFTFPLGIVDGEGNGFYHPLTISAPSSATDAFTARYLYQNHNLGLVTDTAIENPSLCEHWKLLRDTGTSSVAVKLGWNTNSCNVFGLDSMHVAVWDTASDKWLDKGNNGTTGTISVGTVVSDSALSIFGVMTLADKFCTSLRPVTTATDVTCPGNSNGTTRVNTTGATPPYSYVWGPRTLGSASLWDLSADSYYVTVTDSRGCAVMDSTEVNNPDTIQLTLTVTPSECHDSVGTAKVDATGGAGNYFYFWTPGGQTTDSIGDLPAGIYELIVSDYKGCSVDTTVNINDSDGPDADVDSLVNVDCSGNNTGYASIVVTGGDEYDPAWPCHVVDPTNLTARNYPVITQDDEGCITILNVTITEPSPISINFSTTQSLCGVSTGSATVFASGGTGSFSYQWSSGGNGITEDSLPSGFDTVSVTDENGCVAIAVLFINDSNSMSLSMSKTDLNCFDVPTGSVSLSVSGGSSPYSYSWFPVNDTTSSVDSLTEGQYIAYVSDTNNCLVSDTIYVSGPPPLLLHLFTTDASNDSTPDGTARIEVTGGTPPYNYFWHNNEESGYYVSGLADGIDTIEVSDDNNCLRIEQFNIKYISQIVVGSCGTLNSVYDLTACTIPGTPCTTPGCTLNIITDFGATPNDGLSDECAFEMLNNWIENQYPDLCKFGVNIYIPSGTYDVGRETFLINAYGRKHNPICLSGCNDVTIIGDPPDVDGNPVSKIVTENCLRFGAFDRTNYPSSIERLLACACYTVLPGQAAEPGATILLSDCNNITIENLELNGNIENLSIGGWVSDNGIQLEHDGILIYNSSNTSVNNVYSHDFGRDGIHVAPFQSDDPLALVINNSRFNRNRRNGLSWTSGRTLFAYNCQFNENGLGSFSSSPRDGIDLEWEGYNHVQDGHFINCEIKYNRRVGVESSAAGTQRGSLYDGNVRDIFFNKCIVVAGDKSVAIHPGARKMEFTCCEFYGHSQYPYDGYFIPGANNDWNTKFFYCSFNEEYQTAGGIKSFRMDNRDGLPGNPPLWDCANQGGGGLNMAYSVFDNQSRRAGRVLFNQCHLNTTFFNSIATLWGSHSHPPHNSVYLENCFFNNYGIDGSLPNNSGLFNAHFDRVWFRGYNRLARPIVARNTVSGVYGSGYSTNVVRGNPPMPCNSDASCFSTRLFINYSPCHDRYENTAAPFYWQLYSNNSCSPCNDPDIVDEWCLDDLNNCITSPCVILRLAPSVGNENVKSTDEESTQITVYPVPANDYLRIGNIKRGDTVALKDVLGRDIIKSSSQNNFIEFKINSVPPDIYFLMVNGVFISKIIKW